MVTRRLMSARELLRSQLSAKVLVIEDEPIVAMSIAHVMTRMGHEICGIAHNRQEALARMRESRPDLILADVRLGNGDNGITTVREITDRRAIPVIFITGYAHELLAEERLRPTLVIGKPFVPRTLEIAVRRALGSATAGSA
jgi:CheY-like chemotaxis protein